MKPSARYSVALLLVVATACFTREYRVDSQERFDAVSRIVMRPGDAILLKRGMQFTGMLVPRGNGVGGRQSGSWQAGTGRNRH
jgi:hypothetical protein